MYLRRHRRRKKGQNYDYWTLVESVRTAKGPRQRIVAHIGKEPGLDEDERLGWEQIGRLLDGDDEAAGAEQLDLFAEDKPEAPLWAQVNLGRIRVERVRQFGKVYVALALWRRLGLHRFFEEHLPPGRESVGWAQVASILALGRFCEQASELALAERWYGSTALEDLMAVDVDEVYDNRLYRGLDRVLPLRRELFSHLKGRYESWFGTRFEFLLYDITSTYFEGRCEGNAQAQRGYSRDQRPDCKQVCLGLVVTPEGLPLAYEVFDGNRADVTTVQERVELMESHYGVADRIWVLDRGMVSEANLEYLRGKGARYIVGTPKSHLKNFALDLLEQGDFCEVRAGVEVKLVKHPDCPQIEQYVLCRSQGRGQKEAAMLSKQKERLRKKLDQIDLSLRRRGQKLDPVERRIGRWLGRHTMAEKIFTVEVQIDAAGRACGRTGLRIANHRRREQSRLVPTGPRDLSAANQLPGGRPTKAVAVVYTTDTGRSSLSLRQKRLGAAAGLSPQRRACASAHSDLFSGSGDVARPGKLAAGQRPRHLCAASVARTGKSTLNGRGGTAARGTRSAFTAGRQTGKTLCRPPQENGPKTAHPPQNHPKCSAD